MTEAVGWTAVVIAVAAMIRGEVAAYTARKVARDKLEFDIQLVALRVKASRLKRQNAQQASQIASLTEGQRKCEQDHANTKIAFQAQINILKQQVTPQG